MIVCAQAALVKCVVICAGLVALPRLAVDGSPALTAVPLVDQLGAALDGGACGVIAAHYWLRPLRVQCHGVPAHPVVPARAAGLEIETWSLLPAGSGLGTSSILAAAAIAAVCGAAGVEMDKQSLAHEVLKVEQMLTTGGTRTACTALCMGGVIGLNGVQVAGRIKWAACMAV